MSAVLDVDGISVLLGGMPVVEGVSMTVGGGEMVALTGPNGAGKSTTLRAVAGLERIAAGRVLLGGREIQNRPAHQVATAGCTLVLEGARIFHRLSIEANLRLGAYGCDRHQVAARLAEQADRFPALASRLGASAASLSGGEQKLLALAQGLMAAPRVLLLDEPAVGLDAATAEHVAEVLRGIRQRGTAVLVADRGGGAMADAADRTVVLHLGRVVDAPAGGRSVPPR